MERVQTLGNQFETLARQFRQLLLDASTDVLECCKSAVAFLLKAVEVHISISKAVKNNFGVKYNMLKIMGN